MPLSFSCPPTHPAASLPAVVANTRRGSTFAFVGCRLPDRFQQCRGAGPCDVLAEIGIGVRCQAAHQRTGGQPLPLSLVPLRPELMILAITPCTTPLATVPAAAAPAVAALAALAAVLAAVPAAAPAGAASPAVKAMAMIVCAHAPLYLSQPPP